MSVTFATFVFGADVFAVCIYLPLTRYPFELCQMLGQMMIIKLIKDLESALKMINIAYVHLLDCRYVLFKGRSKAYNNFQYCKLFYFSYLLVTFIVLKLCQKHCILIMLFWAKYFCKYI